MDKIEFTKNIRKLVEKNKSSEAIEVMQRLFTDIKNERLLDETIILKGRFKANEGKYHTQTQSNDEYKIESNKINQTILNLTGGINEVENVPNRKLERYFREVKTFPRSYFYQLLTIITFSGLFIILYFNKEVSEKEDKIEQHRNRIEVL